MKPANTDLITFLLEVYYPIQGNDLVTYCSKDVLLPRKIGFMKYILQTNLSNKDCRHVS